MNIQREYSSPPALVGFDIAVERGFHVSMGFNAGLEGSDGERSSGIDDMGVSVDNEGW